ncbi:MAG: ABC transporter permease [Planctomycetota bacterium]|nr:ABC transporter permease [Planctomycetota bacterium]
MYAYVIRRLLLGLLIIWGVYTITFLAVNLAPGDPFTAKESAKVTEADLDRLRKKWGYDLPVIERYFLHVRRMFYADPEVLEYEGGGIGYEVFAEGGVNRVRARVQEPPDEIVLTPTKESRLDDGAKEVRLARADDGSYPRTAIIQGQYRFGLRSLSCREARIELDSQGVLITYEGGFVTARPILATPPAKLRLEPALGEGEALELEALEGGRYSAAAAEAGRYVVVGTSTDLLVPKEALEEGGIGFNLGTSIGHNKPVTEFLAPKLWATLKLGFWALFLNYLVGIALGVVSAVRKDTRTDHGIMVGAFFLYSMPGFWLAVMLQLVFAVTLQWLPIHGMGDGSFLDGLRHYAMPVFVLGVAGAAGTARYQRSAILEVLSEDYVRTARAKGVDERTVIWKHVMRNSLLPVITLFGLSMPFLVSGAVITESIFSWPGIGDAAIKAISGRDVFVITAVTLMATIMVVVGNLVADILYAVADPRVRLR